MVRYEDVKRWLEPGVRKEIERFQHASAFGRRLAYMTAARKVKDLISRKA